MRSDLVTLDTIRARLALETADTKDDDLVRQLCTEATRHVVQFCRRGFVPVRRVHVFDALGPHIGARVLELDVDLLEATQVVNGSGAILAGTDYRLSPANRTPKGAVELLNGHTWTYTGDWQEAISIDGVWGYHEDWSDAWVNTGEILPAGGLDESSTTLVVSDSARLDAWGHKAFGIGQLLRIDDEYLVVRAVDAATHTLTLIRAANGTVAAVHLAGAALHRYAPMADVEGAAAALAIWLYKSRDTLGEKIQFLDGTQVITNQAPAHIKLTLMHYRRVSGQGI